MIELIRQDNEKKKGWAVGTQQIQLFLSHVTKLQDCFPLK